MGQGISAVAASPVDTPVSAASENIGQVGSSLSATEVPRPTAEPSLPMAHDDEEPNLSMAAPPAVPRPGAPNATDAKAKKLQMLGFEAPAAKAQKGGGKRSLVGGASMASPLEQDLI